MIPTDDDEIEHIYLEDEDKQPPVVRDPHVKGALDDEEEHRKLRRILIGITLVAALLTFIRGVELQRFLADFMAVFAITFSALKFSDIESFAHVYRNYDWIAKLFRPWGYVLPFVVAFIGFWYMLSEAPDRLNILALIITGTAGLPAIIALRAKHHKQYAYHPTLLRLPFTRISVLENVVMFVVAVSLLVLSIT